MSLARRWWLGLGRAFVTSLGICSIAWAFFSLPFYNAEIPLSAAAEGILAGEQYSAKQLARFGQEIEATPAGSLSSSSLRDIAVIRLHQFEVKKTSDTYDAALAAVTAALAADPNDAFIWLADFSLHRRQTTGLTENDFTLLRSSYRSGPNEGWIAVRRNPLALGVFPSLPNDLAGRALSEFVGIVRSGLYQDAAKILAGPGWPIREQLLKRIAQLDDLTRSDFAAVLDRNDVIVDVPGVDNHVSHF